ncbi:hypothetical protein DL93DRAFT_2232729 [Clavulina sp. PMI_390]|nr:hypothetical protein DL93DRAFT_2232729 [Clavulina sp. PMI_390]
MSARRGRRADDRRLRREELLNSNRALAPMPPVAGAAPPPAEMVEAFRNQGALEAQAWVDGPGAAPAAVVESPVDPPLAPELPEEQVPTNTDAAEPGPHGAVGAHS